MDTPDEYVLYGQGGPVVRYILHPPTFLPGQANGTLREY